MGSTDVKRPHAEFMRVWEEGYVATGDMFEAMHMQGVGVFSGEGLRRPDGGLDRDRIRAWIESATLGIPYAKLRLMRSPAGLTPPAWVPDDAFDLDRHVRFATDVVSLSPTALPQLIGWNDGALDLRHPLWRLQFTELADGRVALGVLMHHSGGDALRTLKFLAALTTSDPSAAPAAGEDPFIDTRSPRRGELPLLALRMWAAAGDGAAERWRDYWSRPWRRRARRAGGRVLRPLRERRARTSGASTPPRHSAFRTIPGEVVQAAAESVGATMNDIVVAASIRAASADGSLVRVRVPVLRRRTEDSRNRVTDVAIVGSSSTPVDELVVSVREQLRDGPTIDEPARDVGYVTLVPWLSRARHLCGSRLEDMIVLPASLPTDELSTFALLYDGRLSVVATAQASEDLGAIMDRLESELTAGALSRPDR